MSYEICVFDAAQVTTPEAAYSAWDQGAYADTSLPESERSASKWRIKDALLAFNPELVFVDPTLSSHGILRKLFHKPPPRRNLNLSLDTHGRITSFIIFDDVVEIELPWDAQRDQVPGIVRDVWRHLDMLTQMGISMICDTERGVRLNLEADFDVVVEGYIKNLNFDDNEPAASPASASTEKSKPFTGNIGASKPWWKF